MKLINDTLFIIPARGGSKGLPQKNILPLNGKPLICYSIDAARGVCSDENICLSTNDEKIIAVAENYGLKVPFKRPESLSTDFASTWDVVKHAVEFYEKSGMKFNRICLLQPTSPLRNSKHIQQCFDLWEDEIDMIVSVKESKKAAILCHEIEDGFLTFTLNKGAKRRQDLPEFYEYNGAIYLLNFKSFKEKPVSEFSKIKKYVMSAEDSVDIDDELDFKLVEFILKR